MNAMRPAADRPFRDRRVPHPVLAARAQRIAFDRIVAACPACCSGGRDGLPEALAGRLAAHPRLRSRTVARLRDEVGDLQAFAHALSLRDAKTPDGASAAVLAGLLFRIGSLGPAVDHASAETLRATFGACATSFALRHAALSPPRSFELDVSDPDLADRIAADGRAILGLWWGLSIGPAARWLAAPLPADPVPLLSGEAVAAMARALTSQLLAEAEVVASGEADSSS